MSVDIFGSTLSRSSERKYLSLDGHPSGFDYLRITLAASVVIWHSILICYGSAVELTFWDGPLRPLIQAIVPSFFALSGFLVCGSLVRNDIPAFLTLRALRIFPALFCEVVISAFLIGPAFSELPVRSYFSQPDFYSYFLNILGDIHYRLPGVFSSNPFRETVNQQLWTIPSEFKCYVSITLISLFGLVDRRRYLLYLLIIVTVLLSVSQIYRVVYTIIPPGTPGKLLILSFLLGVCFYRWHDKIPDSWPLFIISVVASSLLLNYNATLYFAAFPLAYATIWIGTRNPRKIFIVAGADYSYGVYLYGFPIQQALAALIPQSRVWYINAAVSLLVAGFAAYLSWTFVESPIMKRKRSIVGAVTAGIARLAFWRLSLRKVDNVG